MKNDQNLLRNRPRLPVSFNPEVSVKLAEEVMGQLENVNIPGKVPQTRTSRTKIQNSHRWAGETPPNLVNLS